MSNYTPSAFVSTFPSFEIPWDIIHCVSITVALGLFLWDFDIKGHLGIFKNVYGRVVGGFT